jgi:3-hydroxyisobutyrate dehydrogenase-like beta-hydroxyacid dehydrogenase
MTSYGYIGLGQMGAAMTARLLDKGLDVSVFDIADEAVEQAVSMGASRAESAAEIADKVDIISICVPAAHHVEAVLNGPNGIADRGRDRQTILIHSTVLPDTVTWAQSVASAWGGVVHDACVAGGVDAARTGELVILAGAVSSMDIEASELLAVYGNKVIDAGPLGAGAALKLAVNVMTYAQLGAAHAAFEVLRNAQGQPESLVDAWRHVGQLGKLTELFLPTLALPPDEIPDELRAGLRQIAGLADKDLRLAAELSSGGGADERLLHELRAAMPSTFGLSERSPE